MKYYDEYYDEEEKISWDYIKQLMAEAHCGKPESQGSKKCYNEDLEIRKMIVALMKDNYERHSKIFIIS